MTKFSWEIFCDVPLVGIIRRMPVGIVARLADAAVRGGLTTIEVTVDSPDFAVSLDEIRRISGGRMNIGAGTVCTLDNLRKALDAGAAFIVTPIVAEEVIMACKSAGVPVFAGAYTPTEIYRAWSLGADMVKVFPADQLGPAFIRNVRAPLPQISLLPTGGVTLESLPAFIKAGAAGFGISSPMFPPALVKEEKWDEISNLISQFVELYKAIAGEIVKIKD
jgi:2-dehydro-3-deoxyphosphogluconate aldolase/(4S)-4-hydroxy-2-oxoglutarate aldolase